MFKLAWWKDESNVKGANALVGFLKVVVPLLVVSGATVAGWFGWQKQQTPSAPPPAAVSAPAPSMNITADNGSAVQTGSGTQVLTGANSTVTIGFSEQAFFDQLDKREAQLRADLTQASEAERTLLESQLQAVSAQKDDIDTAYKETLAELAALRATLETFKGQVGETELAAAQSAVTEGDRGVADQVLSQAADAGDARTAARASFARAKIAEQEFRWADAAALYARAAELDPTYENLVKAREMAWRIDDLDASLRFGAQLVEVAEASAGPADLSKAYNEYGLSLNNADQFAASRDMFQKAADLTANTFGEMNPEYATTISNLAEAWHDLGDLEKAEELYRKVLEIDRATIGDESANYAVTVQSLADLLYELERFDEAKQLYEEAYAVRSVALEDGHPDMAESMGTMAYVLWERGEIDKARDLHKRALALATQTLGPDHSTTVLIREDHDEFMEEEGE
ncbi:tetratricopeptide repeat protein [Litoreibacter ponti]|uniref:Tetratricopeptide repeat protein n=1 Tax=Litoreibacter ponti TaxID=1510457 RepID=A0A2T6BDB5_9RHOB|nr:tetratricopeptide repeat protein [Litoreibacter ponti]PTX54063.1 tetratricopeptide repeat protein [Litoreibacter ponti]